MLGLWAAAHRFLAVCRRAWLEILYITLINEHNMVMSMSEKTKREIISWIGIFTGCSIMSAGFVLFINPYYIVPGGTYGASIVLHSLFQNIQVGTFAYFF